VLNQHQIITETKLRQIRQGNIKRTSRVDEDKQKAILDLYKLFQGNKITLNEYLKTLVPIH